MADLLEEIARFRQWAGSTYPEQPRYGEWECDYPHWGPLYKAVLEFVIARPYSDWSREEREAVLYSLARDNEMEHLAEEIRTQQPETLVRLAEWAIHEAEPDAKWQLAEQLGIIGQGRGNVEPLLVALANDTDEYVRRRALSSLARLAAHKNSANHRE